MQIESSVNQLLWLMFCSHVNCIHQSRDAKLRWGEIRRSSSLNQAPTTLHQVRGQHRCLIKGTSVWVLESEGNCPMKSQDIRPMAVSAIVFYLFPIIVGLLQQLYPLIFTCHLPLFILVGRLIYSHYQLEVQRNFNSVIPRSSMQLSSPVLGNDDGSKKHIWFNLI